MKILAIETSCDETSIAIIESFNNEVKVLAHGLISQINKHVRFGGVFPTLSRREHEKNLVPILIDCLDKSNFLHLCTGAPCKGADANASGDFDNLLNRYPDLEKQFWDFVSKYDCEKIGREIDAIAVTNGPGLPPALWVGVNFSKCLAKIFGDKPIYPINHMEGHIISALAEIQDANQQIIKIQEPEYPLLSLLISGGHTEFVLSSEAHKYEKIGETQDDAVGECFDKVARLLGLPYPGGPEVGKLAQIGRDTGLKYDFKFPRPMLHTKDFNFSFSGLKTHILYFVRSLTETKTDWSVDAPVTLTQQQKIEIATEFEYVVKDILFEKAKKALEETGAKSFVVGGGVISSPYLRSELQKLEDETGCKVYLSEKQMATDNALMIALVAATQMQNKKEPTSDFIAVGSKNYNWN